VTTHDDTIAIRARDLRLVTWTGSVAAGIFLVVAAVTTQVASIRAGLPFTEDPYDLVTCFAVIAIVVIGVATLVRAIGERSRQHDPLVARRMAIGAAIATVIVAVGVVSDILAMTATSVDPGAPGMSIVLVLLGATAGTTIVALACVGRARTALVRAPAMADAEPDVLDELGSIAGSVGATRIADRVAGWMERSSLSPRRHRILVGFVGGAAAGLAAVVWHAIREGPWASPVAAAVFGALMAIGVIGAYLICLGPLRLVRRPRPD